MTKKTDGLILEMHSNIAVLTTEFKNLRLCHEEVRKDVADIKEMTIVQNGQIARNKGDIAKHVKLHDKKEKLLSYLKF